MAWLYIRLVDSLPISPPSAQKHCITPLAKVKHRKRYGLSGLGVVHMMGGRDCWLRQTNVPLVPRGLRVASHLEGTCGTGLFFMALAIVSISAWDSFPTTQGFRFSVAQGFQCFQCWATVATKKHSALFTGLFLAASEMCTLPHRVFFHDNLHTRQAPTRNPPAGRPGVPSRQPTPQIRERLYLRCRCPAARAGISGGLPELIKLQLYERPRIVAHHPVSRHCS